MKNKKESRIKTKTTKKNNTNVLPILAMSIVVIALVVGIVIKIQGTPSSTSSQTKFLIPSQRTVLSSIPPL